MNTGIGNGRDISSSDHLWWMSQPDQIDIQIEQYNTFLHIIATMRSNGLNHLESSGVTVQRIDGGSNNALYKISTNNESYACKLCVEDGRHRAAREFGALSIIQSAGADLSPRPILLDEDKTILPYPVVLYQWIDGVSLQPPIQKQQLSLFLESYHQIHAIHPSKKSQIINQTSSSLPNAWFHWFDFQTYVDEIRGLYSYYTPWLESKLTDGLKQRNRLENIVDSLARVVSNTEVNPNQENIPLRLMRVDPNLSNTIVDVDDTLRWIDWEYSGWGDPALDLAELRWHASLQPLGDNYLQWLRSNYQLSFCDPNFYQRLWVWDHILATRWPFLILRSLWSNHYGPDRERLSTVTISTDQLYQRLKETIQRAECLYSGDGWI